MKNSKDVFVRVGNKIKVLFLPKMSLEGPVKMLSCPQRCSEVAVLVDLHPCHGSSSSFMAVSLQSPAPPLFLGFLFLPKPLEGRSGLAEPGALSHTRLPMSGRQDRHSVFSQRNLNVKHVNIFIHNGYFFPCSLGSLVSFLLPEHQLQRRN